MRTTTCKYFGKTYKLLLLWWPLYELQLEAGLTFHWDCQNHPYEGSKTGKEKWEPFMWLNLDNNSIFKGHVLNTCVIPKQFTISLHSEGRFTIWCRALHCIPASIYERAALDTTGRDTTRPNAQINWSSILHHLCCIHPIRQQKQACDYVGGANIS